jgi:type II secretory pathway component PulF
MQLAYEAIDERGRRQRSTVEARDARQAMEKLNRQGLRVTDLRDPLTNTVTNVKQTAVKVKRKLNHKSLVLFTRQVAMLLKAGSGLVPALTAIRRQMTKPEERELIGDLIHHLEEGAALTDALRQYPDTFSSAYCAVIAAGEASASLPSMFERLAAIVRNQQAMRNKVLGACAYPCLLVVLCVKIVIALTFFVIPRFADMFDQLGVEVPATTQIMLDAGSFFRDYWWALLIGIVVTVTGGIWLLRTPKGKQTLMDVQLKLPLIGKLRRLLIQAQIFRTMGMLLEARVGVLDALELSRGVTKSSEFVKLFDALDENISAGRPISAAFDKCSLVDPAVCQAIRTGEDSGNLGGAITYCADVLDETNTQLLNTLAKLIEPAILIVMGVVVGIVAVSLFMPLFDLTSAMN